MKIKTLKYSMIVMTLLFTLTYSCKKDDKKDNPDPEPTLPVLLHVNAIIISGGNPTDVTSVSVGLSDMNHSGTAVTGAIVKVNGIDIEDKGSGAYTLLITNNPITAGTNVTLLVRCSSVDYTVSAVMPESGKEIKVDFTGCHEGSYMALGNNI
jgi:hypothetical protein